jgi:hypothetical protein
MALYDYQQSKKISQFDPSFLAILFALMRKADDFNTAKIRSLWPLEYEEMRQRYNAPGGILPEELEEDVKKSTQ